MTQSFYSADTSYPSLVLPILERIRYYFCYELLYSSEEYNTSQDRFILTDIGPHAFRDASDIFQVTNVELPFTAYSFDENDIKEDTFNTYARTGHIYVPSLSTTVSMIPMIWTIPMITFYEKASDYSRALRILNYEKARKVKLSVSVTMNSVATSIPIVIEFEDISKGSYAFEFEQQLTTGNILDISHPINVHYYDYQLANGSVYPVDDIYVTTLAAYSGDEYRQNQILESNVLVPDTPLPSSTDPEDEEEDIAVDYTIIINFNVAMNEDSVAAALDITPFVPYELTWNATGTILAIDPTEDLSASTEYTVTIDDSAYSARDVYLAEDYEFTFTTGA